MVPVGETAPTPPSIVTVVAFSLFQLNVVLCPAKMDVGSAVNVTVGGTVFTFTVMLNELLPPAPVAVNTYVVVCVGDTEALSLNCRSSLSPIGGSTLRLVAFVVFQVSVTRSPGFTLFLSAETVIVGPPPGGGLFPPVEPDPLPQAVKNKVVVAITRRATERRARETRFTNHPESRSCLH